MYVVVLLLSTAGVCALEWRVHGLGRIAVGVRLGTWALFALVRIVGHPHIKFDWVATCEINRMNCKKDNAPWRPPECPDGHGRLRRQSPGRAKGYAALPIEK